MVEYLRSHLSVGRARPGKPLKPVVAVVVHWTANSSPGADALMHREWCESLRNPKEYASAHFYVDDRRIVECIPLNEWAYHVGTTTNPEIARRFGTYLNSRSICIEWCVAAGSNGGLTYRNVAGISSLALAMFNLPADALLRHTEITGKGQAPGSKDPPCPAFFYQDEYARRIGFQGTAAQVWQQFQRDVELGLNQANIQRAMGRG